MTKTRLLKHFLLLFALIAGSTSVWAETVPNWSYAIVNGDGDKLNTTNMTFTVDETHVWSYEGTTVAAGTPTVAVAKSNNAYWLKFGSSGSNYYNPVILSTTAFNNEKVTKVRLNLKHNGTKVGTLTVKQGNITIGTCTTDNTSSIIDVECSQDAVGNGGKLEIKYEVAQALYIGKIEVWYETSGTTYSVTYDCNGGTSDCPDNLTGITPGTSITLADAPTKTGNTFDGWSDGSETYEAGAQYTVNSNVTFTAQWTSGGETSDETWVLTNLADLTENDVFVIVGNNGSNYAMSNDKGTGSGPSAVGVTVSGGKITSTVADKIKWNISGNASDGYTFYPNGDSEKWLYCTNTNDGVRVGTNTNNAFVIDDDYLYNTATSRYVGIYNSSNWRCYTSINANISGQSFAFYKKVTGDVTVPSITASNVEIEYDATEGAISYTINNPVEGGVLTAAVPDGSWVTLGTVGETVPFTCSANTVATARTATVTLTYTYNTDETVTKEVTVTQAAAPAVISTIPALFAAATSTETSVNVTFGDWVVSGVSTNGKNVFVTDNSGNGFVIYYNSDMSGTFAAGNILSGTAVSCTLKKYNGFAELLNVDATALTITAGGTVSAAEIAMADLAGVNTGALVSYQNLTCSVDNSGNSTKYYLSDGTTTLQVYNALFAFDALEDGKTYNITGIYQQYNNTKEILPRSAADIVEVVSTEPQIVVEATTINLAYNATSGEIPFTIVNPVENASFGAGTFDTPWITNVEVEKIDATHYKVTFNTEANTGEERSATITISYNGVTKDVTVTQAAYEASLTPVPGYYEKVTSTDDITDGQYLIVYEGDNTHDAVAFNGGLETLDAANNGIGVTIANNQIDATTNTRSAEFTIIGGSLKSASGYYIGNLSNNNGLSQDTHYDIFSHEFSIDNDGNAVIASHTIDDFIYLRYNNASNQNRFRYYKSGQQAVQLYKYIPEYETVETAHEYITFCSTKALDFSQVEGLNAYIVTKVNTSSVSIQKIEAAVPAGTGLILKNTGSASSYEVPVVAEATAPVGNLLRGVTVPTLIGNTTATDYILYDGTFYPASQGTLPAGKAYLRVENTSAPELGLDFSGETTGIVNVNRETITNNQYYTLDGRRVENPTNGIYIINGRKVVIK